MTRPDRSSFDIGHPAPDRERVSGWTLLFALAGGAAAWSGQIAVNAALGAVCVVGGAPDRGGAAPYWAQALTAAVNVAALLVALGALLLSAQALRRTRPLDHPGGVVDAGEGRTRFMAIWGVFAGILFIVAIGFNTISVFWRGLCA